MDKFSRILFVIFILLILNLGLSLYIITFLPKLEKNQSLNNTITDTTKNIQSPQPSTKPVTPPNTDIKSDLNIIKAEIRSLRESLITNGLIVDTVKTNNE